MIPAPAAAAAAALIETQVRPGTAHLALPIFEHVPAGHLPWPIGDDRHAPLLQCGDYAVIDPSDRAIVHGELFLVMDNRHVTLWQVCYHFDKARGRLDRSIVNLRPLDRPATWEEAQQWVHEGRRLHLSDHGLRADTADRLVVGRVVGVLDIAAAYRNASPTAAA